jgi:hypothetical protein
MPLPGLGRQLLDLLTVPLRPRWSDLAQASLMPRAVAMGCGLGCVAERFTDKPDIEIGAIVNDAYGDFNEPGPAAHSLVSLGACQTGCSG